MPTQLFDPLTPAVCGLAGVLLGLVELLGGLLRGVRPWARSLGLAGVLGLVAVVAGASGQPPHLWQPPLLLATVELVLALVRSPRPKVGRNVWPAVQAVCLLAAGVVLAGWQLHQVDAQVEDELVQTDTILSDLSDPIDPNAAPSRVARTDSGHDVPLFTVLAGTTNTTADAEERYLRDQRVAGKVIQTAPADSRYNCHGWVFTGGRYWVRGRQVPGILADNGYQAVARPAAGDLAVFRDTTGEVTHTGLVRLGEGGGPTLIESKWGRLGRFIHTADGHVYRGHTVTYYHRPRGGHELRDSDYPRAGEAVARGSGI